MTLQAHDRAMLLTVGTCLTVVGWSLQPPYVFAGLVERIPNLWQLCFMAAGITTVGWALVPWSRRLYLASAILVLAATSTRGMALVVLAGQWPGVAWFAVTALVVWAWPRVRDELR